ncbi:MAG TPA: hypothetical protein VK184_23395 [Nostocaceae cyanobacterium]|nr:hypothetical protein [Nostocaceae cyanobacterium]
MTYERIRRPSSQQPAPQQTTSQFASRPFKVPPRQTENTASESQDNQQQSNVVKETDSSQYLDLFPENRPPRQPNPPRIAVPSILQRKPIDIQQKEEQTTEGTTRKPLEFKPKDRPTGDIPLEDQQQQTTEGTTRKPVKFQPTELETAEKPLEDQPIGLAAPNLTNEFAKAAYDFWKEPSNKGKPLRDIVDFLVNKVNEELPYKVDYRFEEIPGLGVFDYEKWQMYINISLLSTNIQTSTVGELHQNQVAEIANTIYHESRHAEQTFLIAQKLAGEGKNIQEIEDYLIIPEEVAAAAAKQPLKNTGGNQELINQVQGWEDFMFGKYADYSAVISLLTAEITHEIYGLEQNSENKTDKNSEEKGNSQKLDNLVKIKNMVDKEIHEFLIPFQTEINQNQQRNQVDNRISQEIETIILAATNFNIEVEKHNSNLSKTDVDKLNESAKILAQALQDAYVNLAHEKDAWAVEDAVAEEFHNIAGNK